MKSDNTSHATRDAFYAKQSLGQNFLVNPYVLDKIIEAAAISQTDNILEVGPGTGALTDRLVATGAHIIAVEKDRRLIEPLREKFPGIEIIEGDILKLETRHVNREIEFSVNNTSFTLHDLRYKIVANIPYYLTSHLIRLMLEKWPSPSLAILMVQEEVGRRMMAVPPDMNLLALSVQLYVRLSIVTRVSRNSFRPVPDVDSMVVKLETCNTNREANEKILAVARKAFGQKRKQLSATIQIESLHKAGIDPKTRPQELSIDDWVHLVSGIKSKA